MLRTCVPHGVLLLCALTATGCASNPAITRMVHWLQSGDPEDDNRPGYEDHWSQVGKEGRGYRKMDDERDPWNQLLRSPKAAAIENNLGIR